MCAINRPICCGKARAGWNLSGNFVLAPLGAATRSERISQDVQIGLIRVNYRWGGPILAKY
ncbi:hypothetical protein [Bradyrhizobium canariense]|uniref:hypothetical protein n=1 Tax=Bradyrhizobium canariense TaxID=255045 RepID=UPI001B8A27AE|nr:hypothetical protein [Bradyrhizobium canariense]MBR0950590.1 hypothetical protein [Bradyrhizobium canariense]